MKISISIWWKILRKMASRTFSKVSTPAPKIPVYRSKKRITVVGLPLADINRRGIPSSAHHAAILIATFKLRLLNFITGLPHHPLRMSLLRLDKAVLPCEPQACLEGPASGFHSGAYPSVYVVFKGISATGECGILGPTYAALTRSFAPSAIMTFPLTESALGKEEPLNYADLFSNCTTRSKRK